MDSRTSRWPPQKPEAVVILATLLGLFLRLIDVPSDLYADELWIVKSSSSSFPVFLQAVLSDWVHPPLFFFFMRWLDGIMGLNEVSGRIAAILFGSLSIPVIYWLGKRLSCKSAGTIAAILLALSPIHIWHSDYGRHYSLFVLLVLLSMVAFVELWRNPRSALWSALFILSNALLVYTHYFGWLLVLVEALSCILFRVMSVRRWLVLHATLGLLYVPWLMVVIPLVSAEPSGGPLVPQVAWLSPPRLLTPVYTIVEFNGGIPVRGAGLAGILLLMGLATLTLKRVIDRSPEGPFVIFLLLSIFVPFVLVFTVSRIVQPLWLPRVMMVSLPAYYLLIAAGSLQFLGHRVGKVLPLVPVAWIIVAASFHMDRPHRLPFELIADYLEKHSSSGDLVIAQNYYLANSLYSYYEGDGAIYQMGDSHISILPDILKVRSVEALLELTELATRVLIVTYLRRDEDLHDQLPASYRSVSQRLFTGKGEDWLNSTRTVTVTVYNRSSTEESKKPLDDRAPDHVHRKETKNPNGAGRWHQG